MAYNKDYYEGKKLKIEQRRQANLQRFINFTFDFTSEASSLTEQLNEIMKEEKESINQDSVTGTLSEKKK